MMFVNPVLRRFSDFAAYIGFWFIIAVLNFLVLIAGLKLELVYAAADSLIFNSILAILGLSFWYPVKYITFEKTKFYRIIFGHLTGSITSSAVWVLLGSLILFNIFDDSEYQEFLFNSIPWRFLSGVVFYFFISALYYVIIYYSELQERNKNESELKNLVTMAELRTLKFQLNPHFIFNALNSLSALTTLDPERARKMTLKISEFLRHSLANTDRQKNKLSEEINNLRLYLDIERERFEDKFDYTEEIEEECLDQDVPNMLLQPLMENAFKHSVYESIDSVNIKLISKMNGNALNIILSNTCEQQSTAKGAGVGIKNISHRLELLYKKKGLLDIKTEGGIFSVKIIIPVEQEN